MLSSRKCTKLCDESLFQKEQVCIWFCCEPSRLDIIELSTSHQSGTLNSPISTWQEGKRWTKRKKTEEAWQNMTKRPLGWVLAPLAAWAIFLLTLAMHFSCSCRKDCRRNAFQCFAMLGLIWQSGTCTTIPSWSIILFAMRLWKVSGFCFNTKCAFQDNIVK